MAFFAAESLDEDAIGVQEVVVQLTGKYQNRLQEEIVEYDRQEIESNDGRYAIVWGRMSWRSLHRKRRGIATVQMLSIWMRIMLSDWCCGT